MLMLLGAFQELFSLMLLGASSASCCSTDFYDTLMYPAFLFDRRIILNHAALKDIGFKVHTWNRADQTGSCVHARTQHDMHAAAIHALLSGVAFKDPCLQCLQGPVAAHSRVLVERSRPGLTMHLSCRTCWSQPEKPGYFTGTGG